MSVVEKIKSLHINPYVNILVTGDNSKTLYMPLWGVSSKIPNVYTSNVVSGRNQIRCTLWDVPAHTNNTNRMFFSDDLSYCMVVYDIPYRKALPSQISAPSIVEYIHQTKVYKLETVIIIIKDETTKPEDYETPRDYCVSINIPPIIVDRKNLSKIQDLPQTLSTRVYQQRQKAMTEEIRALLEVSS